MSKNVIIIGGGIIGLSTAYYLQKEGCSVTVIDQTNMDGLTGGASYVNAGYLTPSHIISLAAPGMITKGIKYMFNSTSPFYMKPRLDLDFLKWTWYFKKSATKEKVEKAMTVIRDINLLSRDLYEEIHDSGDLGSFQLDKRGLLMLYKTDQAGEAESAVAKIAQNLELESVFLNAEELKVLEPKVSPEVKGAIHYLCDFHTSPNEIMINMKSHLEKSGVVFQKNEKVVDFSFSNNKITEIITDKNTHKADEVILAAGSWSGFLSKKLNLKLPMEGGKGYRINMEQETGINYPAILMEKKVAVTPMASFTRFAGTMEMSGLNHDINKKRVIAIANASEQYYEGLEIPQTDIDNAQCGLRPVSPDGLPYIGRTAEFKNLTIGTGHAMMGWSLGPATGKLISEIIIDRKISMNIDSFNPQRKF
ncbi:FAD-dependent oxidoreductase [Aureibaculum sp. 2210JD6-5]|uniref:NAD(P)/FAD-dependent oxidoreductase n=1 Tax=Aureibaculum sp. 2210JD6-5 TaxID=3103957 RepID=UPI002AAEC7EB|nr:FAD-dependent oxidoreductase [Aureibaculum sp. 2210JD6-5]MDY7395886.1 FAD-dependent oxidoreductase [Aureibaculum sp. 2210JD6-5]